MPRDRADYADLKRKLLWEPIFMTRVHHRMAQLYLGKATIEEVLEEVDRGKAPGKPQ